MDKIFFKINTGIKSKGKFDWQNLICWKRLKCSGTEVEPHSPLFCWVWLRLQVTEQGGPSPGPAACAWLAALPNSPASLGAGTMAAKFSPTYEQKWCALFLHYRLNGSAFLMLSSSSSKPNPETVVTYLQPWQHPREKVRNFFGKGSE